MKQLVDEPARRSGGLKITYSDLLSLGESNQKMELFDGEFIMSAMPTPLHQNVLINLGAILRNYVIQKNLGKVFASVDVYLSEYTVLQPDICFVSNERTSINDGKKFNGMPDLVVEILSESTEQRDRTFKFREYAIGGAKEYWMVSPEKKEIEVYQNTQRGFQLVKIFKPTDILNSPLLNEININVTAVFE